MSQADPETVIISGSAKVVPSAPKAENRVIEIAGKIASIKPLIVLDNRAPRIPPSAFPKIAAAPL